MKNKLLIMLLLLSMLFCGCGSVDRGPTVEIVDSVGRTVNIPENPQAIAGLDPLAGQAIIMYGYGDKMLATVGGVQRDMLLQEMCPSLKDAANVKEQGAINAEALLQIGIDLIFIKEDVYADTDQRKKLDATKIPYIVISYHDMESQHEAMHLIGDALNCETEAAEYEAYYSNIVQTVSDIVADFPTENIPRLYHSCNEALKTDNKDSLSADWVSVTRAYNVSIEENDTAFGEKNYYTTLEQIYVWAPDVIICNETGVDDYIMASAKWQGLRAVKEGRVYQVPIGVSRWGHENSTETPLAILWLACTLYPEDFSDFDIIAEMKNFYKSFYSHEVDDETARKILSGEGIRAAGTGGNAP